MTLIVPPSVVPSPIAIIRSRDLLAGGGRISDDPAYLRVRRGVYVRTIEWKILKPWQRYLVRVHAFALVSPHAIFCAESAAVLRGQPLFGEPRDIHVYDPGRTSSRRFGDVVVHTSWNARVVSVGSVNLTSLLDTTLDLARALPPAFGLAVADAAARSSPAEVSARALDDLAGARVDARNRSRLAWVISRMDPASESVGESVSRAVIEWSGFPEPELQESFHYEGCTDRADFFWRRTRSIGESDGWGKYGDDPAEMRAALAAEKRREDRLRRHGHGIARWDFAAAMGVAPLQAAISASGVPRVRAENHPMLATLSRNSRSR